ncbi:MAG: alpha-amylase [Candidatus Thiosymbion ectosymbiont of Robbea hypermnestra]|nr:alpha-amylase [Candidatus Thiosymbion ectosymbiont of Robbea hypermnestra]
MANQGTMMQYFHWDLPANGTLWNRVANEADNLAAAGITALWLPPPTKAVSASDVGYGAYDLWDLGEFDQKGLVRTKYGTRAELEAAVRGAHAAGLKVYLDVVFNHKGGADATERVRATPVNPDNRNQTVGEEREIETWTVFDFPGRGDRYSSLKWRWRHFDAVDYDQITRSAGTIYRLREKRFETSVSSEFGNFDFLLYADIDMDSEEAKADLHAWGEWIVRTLDVDGFRFDAVKHVRSFFFREWLRTLGERFPAKTFFSVGEHFTGDPATLDRFLQETERRMSLFDFPLFFKLRAVSHGNGNFDMGNLVSNTLVAQSPDQAVTFVSNHDVFRHPHEDVADWFKPLAYAFILLRDQGYPCVFYGDYYGASGRPAHRADLDVLLAARRDHAHGPQRNYFDHQNVVGWTRLGDADHPKAMAVVMSDGPGGEKTMFVDRPHAEFRDVTGHIAGTLTSDGNGNGAFRCDGGSVSVWVEA